MAKNLNSVSFTVLLLVLVMASTGFLMIQAGVCPPACTSVPPKFYAECGPVPFTLTDADCVACCKAKYDCPPVCMGVVEGSDKHCHCYSN